MEAAFWIRVQTGDEQHQEFSHHRGKNEIRQNVKAQFWNGLISMFAHDVVIKVSDLISEGIWLLRRKL
jgi:hypothetical protein